MSIKVARDVILLLHNVMRNISFRMDIDYEVRCENYCICLTSRRSLPTTFSRLLQNRLKNIKPISIVCYTRDIFYHLEDMLIECRNKVRFSISLWYSPLIYNSGDEILLRSIYELRYKPSMCYDCGRKLGSRFTDVAVGYRYPNDDDNTSYSSSSQSSSMGSFSLNNSLRHDSESRHRIYALPTQAEITQIIANAGATENRDFVVDVNHGSMVILFHVSPVEGLIAKIRQHCKSHKSYEGEFRKVDDPLHLIEICFSSINHSSYEFLKIQLFYSPFATMNEESSAALSICEKMKRGSTCGFCALKKSFSF